MISMQHYQQTPSTRNKNGGTATSVTIFFFFSTRQGLFNETYEDPLFKLLNCFSNFRPMEKICAFRSHGTTPNVRNFGRSSVQNLNTKIEDEFLAGTVNNLITTV